MSQLSNVINCIVVGSGFSSESITKAGSKVQEYVKRFLKSEEDAMLERIRKYTEEQKKRYTAVQSRAHNDRRAILRYRLIYKDWIMRQVC